MRKGLRMIKPTPKSDERVIVVESESISDYECFEEENSNSLEHLVEGHSPVWDDVIKTKNPGIWDSVRWKLKGSSKIFNEGLKATKRRSMNWTLCKEVLIITYRLRNFPNMEITFKAYDLE